MFIYHSFEIEKYGMPPKDINNYKFVKTMVVPPKKSFKEVANECKNMMSENRIFYLWIDNIVIGAVWEEKEWFIGHLYIDRQYVSLIKEYGHDLEVLKSKLIELEASKN